MSDPIPGNNDYDHMHIKEWTDHTNTTTLPGLCLGCGETLEKRKPRWHDACLTLRIINEIKEQA